MTVPLQQRLYPGHFMLSPSRTPALQVMDDLRQGLVELRRNHPVDLDTVVEGPCERLVFHDRNVVLLRDLPDLERDQVLALCDDKRSAAFQRL